MKLSLIGMLTLAAAGCGGTTGWVPPNGNTITCDPGCELNPERTACTCTSVHNIGEAPSKEFTKNMYGMPQPVGKDILACTATVLYQEDMGPGCNEVMSDGSVDVDCTIWCDDVKLLLTEYCPARNEVGCGCAHTSIGHDVCVAWF